MIYCGLVIDDWCWEVEDKFKLYGMFMQAVAKEDYREPKVKGERMKCPDCRDSELEIVDELHGKDPADTILCGCWYYKCPKCKQEYDKDDINGL